MDKRGISQIVSTVLIVLVSVALVATLFLWGREFIQNINSIDTNVDLQPKIFRAHSRKSIHRKIL